MGLLLAIRQFAIQLRPRCAAGIGQPAGDTSQSAAERKNRHESAKQRFCSGKPPVAGKPRHAKRLYAGVSPGGANRLCGCAVGPPRADYGAISTAKPVQQTPDLSTFAPPTGNGRL